MAILTNDDFGKIREISWNDPASKAVFKAWGLARPTWKAMFQACEDWFVGAFLTTPTTSLKGALETVAGAMANQQARKVIIAWINWRFGRDV